MNKQSGRMRSTLALLVLMAGSPLSLTAAAFTSRSSPAVTSPLFRRLDGPKSTTVYNSASSSSVTPPTSSADLSPAEQKRKQRKELIRKEGGRLAFDTKFGALNPYAIYYGFVSIFLGIPWFLSLTIYQLLQVLTFNKFDKQRRIPVHINHAWGVATMTLTRMFPKYVNNDILDKFYKEGRPAMFVANHNSWQDIPFLGTTIGWRNYKIIAKNELAKVPILGKAIRVAGNIMVDRTNRKSQLQTLKKGIQYLNDGVHLCTFPEGTRTRTGKLTPFKNGAFKMAHKAGAPVIPLSIVGAGNVMPVHWMFPYRPAGKVASVVIHEPVESTNKTEEELAQEVRKAMISSLPDDQRPDKE